MEVTIEQAMAKLMEIGSTPAAVSEADGSNLPQVHALNSLTAIFKTSYLSYSEKKLEKYIPLCLQLAADCLKADVFVDPVQPFSTWMHLLTLSLDGPSATADFYFCAGLWIACSELARARR